MFVLFRPQMKTLLSQRDVTMANWAARYLGADVFEDRTLEITSAMPISVEQQISRVDAMLG